jgi:hypothetical protein
MKIRKMILSIPRDFILLRCFKKLESEFFIEAYQSILAFPYPEQENSIRGTIFRSAYLVCPGK